MNANKLIHDIKGRESIIKFLHSLFVKDFENKSVSIANAKHKHLNCKFSSIDWWLQK